MWRPVCGELRTYPPRQHSPWGGPRRGRWAWRSGWRGPWSRPCSHCCELRRVEPRKTFRDDHHAVIKWWRPVINLVVEVADFSAGASHGARGLRTLIWSGFRALPRALRIIALALTLLRATCSARRRPTDPLAARAVSVFAPRGRTYDSAFWSITDLAASSEVDRRTCRLALRRRTDWLAHLIAVGAAASPPALWMATAASLLHWKLTHRRPNLLHAFTPGGDAATTRLTLLKVRGERRVIRRGRMIFSPCGEDDRPRLLGLGIQQGAPPQGERNGRNSGGHNHRREDYAAEHRHGLHCQERDPG